MAHWCSFLFGAFLLLFVGQRPASANFFPGDQNQVVQFGTFSAMLQECFFQKINAGVLSPTTVAFNNPAAKAISFITVETDQGIDFGGITASITTGTIGTSTAVTMQVNTSPLSLKFINNVLVRMFCVK